MAERAAEPVGNDRVTRSHRSVSVKRLLTRYSKVAALLFALAPLIVFARRPIEYPLVTASGSVASVETVQFKSSLVNAILPYNVILPPGYRESRTTRYPVLYLLHGLTGHYSDWITRTNVATMRRNIE
jgi:S-formylglutathione hydrolase FrmB